MTLFEARSWWTAKIDDEEEFDGGGFCLANVDNDKDQTLKIVTGSLHGVLRVYAPSARNFRAEDLLLESELDEPILHIRCGNYRPGSAKTNVKSLAVLHPRSLAVYDVVRKGGTTASAKYFELTTVFKRTLPDHFTSCNIVSGKFGGNDSADGICVQSMDGKLAFYDTEAGGHLAFVRRLETCILPGPFAYLEETDSFVTCNSSMEIVNYKYQVIAASAAISTGDGSPTNIESRRDSTATERTTQIVSPQSGRVVNKQITATWKINIGEFAMHIEPSHFFAGIDRVSPTALADDDDRMTKTKTRSTSGSDVVVLGERTIFCISEGGDLLFQKRLDFASTCLCSYPCPRKSTIDGADRVRAENVIVASNAGHFAVYSGRRVAWVARLAAMSAKPVALAVAEIGKQTRGMLCCLDENGMVRLTYMGTEPRSATPRERVTSSSVVNFDADRYLELRDRIAYDDERRLASGDAGDDASQDSDRSPLRMDVDLSPTLDVVSSRDAREDVGDDAYAHLLRLNGDQHVRVVARVRLRASAGRAFRNVQLSVACPLSGVLTSAPTIALSEITESGIVVPLHFYASSNAAWISDLDVVLTATTTPDDDDDDDIICSNCRFSLPIALVATIAPPVKETAFKLTLELDKSPPNLAQLLDDALAQPTTSKEARAAVQSTGGNVVTFRYGSGATCTAIRSKSKGRLRVQASHIEPIYLVASEFVRRLRKDRYSVSYAETLPLADLFAAIDEHFRCRQVLRASSSELNDRAQQFRVVQRRLLARFRERNATPLNNLELLMRGTYRQINEIAERVEEAQENLRAASLRLSATVRITLLLMCLKYDLDDANASMLKLHLSPMVEDDCACDPEDGGAHGWEERTDVAITFLLRTALAKASSKRRATVIGSKTSMNMPKSAKKLKKHITILVDRLSKGHMLVGPPRKVSVPIDIERGQKQSDAVGKKVAVIERGKRKVTVAASK
eukprot:g1794.t1